MSSFEKFILKILCGEMFQLNIFELVNIKIVFFMVSPSPKLIKRLCSASSIRLSDLTKFWK